MYEFVHDGHCAGGWAGRNTVQGSILDCRNECANRPDIGFFADRVGASCACYYLKDNCPDDNKYGDHDVKDVCIRRKLLLV